MIEGTGEVTVDKKLDSNISGRDVILIDDIISSGGSIVKACKVLKENGCLEIYAMCAHALLIGDALQRIEAAGVGELIATNSIPGQCAKVDLSPTLSNAIDGLIDV